MSKRVMSDREIERLANSHAEREAFVKSTVVFVVVWVVGALIFLFLPYVDSRFTGYLSTGFFVSFFVAFFGGLITRWLVKESAYEKFYALYKEQKKLEGSLETASN
jgi:hypothetical protein